jgi:hypothetical protein
MKTSSLFFGAVLAAIALADTPRQRSSVEYLSRRRDVQGVTPHSKPRQWSETPDDKTTAQLMSTKNGSNVTYDYTWGGVVLESPPEGTTFKTVKGTIEVPHFSPGNAPHHSWWTSLWLGIDGATNVKDILQAGFDTQLFSNGTIKFHPWIEYYPAGNIWLQDFPICEGDIITITVTAETPSLGVAILENETKGIRRSRTVPKPKPSATIRGQNAEWIEELWGPGFANYHTFRFTNVEAITDSGENLDLTNGTVWDIRDDGQVFTDCKIDGPRAMSCDWIFS